MDDLPPPWIRQFDEQYQTFFYVDPTTNPPRVTWTRPGFNDGQPAPEQMDAMQLNHPGDIGGHASSYFSNDTNSHHNEERYAVEARQATDGITGQGDATRSGGDGDRGFVSSMAKQALMQKLGLRPTKTSNSGLGGLVSSLMGGGQQQYGKPSGAPPFMGGSTGYAQSGGGGGLGGVINSFMGGSKPQQHGGYGQQQQQGGLGGIINGVMGGNKPQGQGGGYGQQQQGGLGGMLNSFTGGGQPQGHQGYSHGQGNVYQGQPGYQTHAQGGQYGSAYGGPGGGAASSYYR